MRQAYPLFASNQLHYHTVYWPFLSPPRITLYLQSLYVAWFYHLANVSLLILDSTISSILYPQYVVIDPSYFDALLTFSGKGIDLALHLPCYQMRTRRFVAAKYL